jgi:hypothetical protein
VLVATIYAFLMVRLATEAAIVAAPALPLTAVAVADHLRERRLERAAT